MWRVPEEKLSARTGTRSILQGKIERLIGPFYLGLFYFITPLWGFV